jgi:hypothetical protein
VRFSLTQHRAIHKGEVLTTLLRDLSASLGNQHTHKIDQVLEEFEEDTPPPTPSRNNHPRRTSPSGQIRNQGDQTDEAHVAASVGSNEGLEFLEEDVLKDLASPETGFLGRNSQIQWMQALQRKLNDPGGEPSTLPTGLLGASEEDLSQRAEAPRQRRHQLAATGPLSDYYFYLDNTDIDIEVENPYLVPPVETAENLFELYQMAVHNPFRILGNEFGDKLQRYYQDKQRGGTMNVCIKWMAIMNLVFAIGARFSQLVGAGRHTDDHSHLVYMSRAVHFLGLKPVTALISFADLSVIQVRFLALILPL